MAGRPRVRTRRTGMTWKNDIRKSMERALLLGLEPYRDAATKLAIETFNRFYTEPPTVPKKTGKLRESGFAAVDGKVVATGGGYGIGSMPPASRYRTPREGVIQIFFSFPMDYALYVHEIQYGKYTLPGSGPFFLSSKLERGEDLMRRFAKNVKATMSYHLGSKG